MNLDEALNLASKNSELVYYMDAIKALPVLKTEIVRLRESLQSISNTRIDEYNDAYYMREIADNALQLKP